MPDETAHKAQAKHNRALAGFLLKHSCYRDWTVTACFYSAVHCMDAVLAHRSNLHPQSHHLRESAMHRLKIVPQDVIDAYLHLKDLSEEARYLCRKPSEQDINRDCIPKLDEVERFMQRELR